MTGNIDGVIFGGSGFIGSHLYEYLVNKLNKHIINADLRKSSKVDTQFCDVRQDIDIKGTYHDRSIIYNLAAIHKTPGHVDREYYETNIQGAENVCQFAHDNKINTIVFTSSIAPYGASEDVKTEESLPMPNTPYGISKLVAEQIHRVWQAEESNKRKLIILRPGVVFGKSEGGNFTRLYQSLKKHMFFYPGRKDTLKASVYVKDLVRIMTKMAVNEPPGVRIYNLCYPEPHTIKDIVYILSKVTGVSKKIPLIPSLLLKIIATFLYNIARLFRLKIMDIHPERVKKLMISTNISGGKLHSSPYKLGYSLEDAIRDWYEDNNNTELI